MVVSVRHGKSGDNGERPSLLRRKVSQFAGDDVDHGTCEKGNNDVARQFLAWGGNWATCVMTRFYCLWKTPTHLFSN